MSDVANAKQVTDNSVAIAVQLGGIGRSKVVQNQLSLHGATTSGIKTNIVGLVVPIHGVHINGTGRRIGRLSVEEHKRLLRVGHNTFASASGKRDPAKNGENQKNAKDFFHFLPPSEKN